VRVLYTVDQTVGTGCANEKRDVMLVQFFLRSASKPGGGLPAIQPPGETMLAVDGIFGPKTAAYIKHYQMAGGGAAYADGKVSPIQGGSTIGAIHEKTLTIVHLNVGYAKRFGAERHSRIDQDSDVPAALRSALFV
jgi:peptidoglycan hydrolase-like protein with peptidoglycan-binding domain